MVQIHQPKGIPPMPPEPRPITQRKFDKGVISIVDASNLPLNALVKADNHILDEDGVPRPSPGHDWYGSSLPATSRTSTSQTFTNLATNPNFEAGVVTGWTTGGGTVNLTAQSSVVYAGTYSLQAQAISGATPRCRHQVTTLALGLTYNIFVRVRVGSTQSITLSVTDSGGTPLQTDTISQTVADGWVLRTLTYTAASVTSIYVRIASATANGTIYVDNLAIGEGITEYFDGNDDDTDDTDYAWTGSPNASTSTKTVYEMMVNSLDGGSFFVTDTEEVHLIAVSGGKIYRSLDNGQNWEQCTGGSFTPGYKVHDEQTSSALYLYNSHDAIVRYTGDIALVTYEELHTPVGPSATETGMAGTDIYTYAYYLSAVNDVGYTPIGGTAFDAGPTNTVVIDRQRSSFDDSNYVTLQWINGLYDVNGDGVYDDLDLSQLLFTPPPLPERYDMYVSLNGAEPVYFDTIDVSSMPIGTLITYVDKGQSPEQSLLLAPEENTTVGPKVGDMALVGTRLYATRDKDNPWRVWISGAGKDIGKFSTAFDGTFIDLQKGSQFRPVKVEDYRDGKGTPLATVWCDSVDGRGCIWQGTLDTFTVGDVSFPVPNFYKLPGSRGTNAPDSVVNVLNDYMYYNSQALYNLGSRAQFLNLLSTDEISANIRPDIRNIASTASSQVAAYYFEANVYFSVPMNSTQNNQIIVFDTERKAWLPKAFDFGVERFFQYTDTTGSQHLLCWKPGDIRFTEIARSIKGAYGLARHTELLTGLVHVNAKNRFDFFWTEEGEFELGAPDGVIDVELAGITRENGYETIDSVTIAPNSAPIGWTKRKWTTHAWTDGSTRAITSYSEPSKKRYFNVQQDVNAYQWRITSDDIDADYLLRTLQVNGTDTIAGKPREWEILS